MKGTMLVLVGLYTVYGLGSPGDVSTHNIFTPSAAHNTNPSLVVTGIETTQDGLKSYRLMVLGDRLRCENEDGSIYVYDPSLGKSMTLLPASKHARLRSVSGEVGGLALYDALCHSRDEAAAQLPSRSVFGRSCEGYVYRYGGWESNVWFDAATGLPVLIEDVTIYADGGKRVHRVTCNIRFDVALDELLFSVTPPPEFTIVLPASEPVELPLSGEAHLP